MSEAFSRSRRSLRADGYRRILEGLLLGVVVLGGWTIWLVYGRVSVYEVTDSARLELDGVVHPIEAQASGQVVKVSLRLGAEVEAGDVLVELDTRPQRYELQEEKTRVGALRPERAALRKELEAEKASLEEIERGARVAHSEAKARVREAEAAERVAAQERTRFEKLREGAHVSEQEWERADAEREKKRRALETARLAVDRTVVELENRASTQRARIAHLAKELAEIQGKARTGEAKIARLEHEVERRRIRAPVAGRVGEAIDLRVGAVVKHGDRLGQVVPAGRLKVVAEFSPSTALGRIRPGQRANLRLAGFPWAQYGAVLATVQSVASEVRNGRMRVELTLRPPDGGAIPLQHGLPGQAEVEVERSTPAALVLRAAGQLLHTAPSAAPKTVEPTRAAEK